MHSEKIKIGVIGCGLRVDYGVLANIIAGKSKDRLEITALFDPSAASIERIRSSVAPNAKAYASEAELLEKSGVDWVVIGSWNCFHADQVIAAVQAGKHVFCEKPLATNIEDCIRIQEALKAAPDRQFFFGLVLRYTSLYSKVKELIKEGVLGRIISMEFNETLDFNHGGYIHGNWRRDRNNAGTHLLEKCCHDFDLVNWLLGSLPVKAASFGGKDFFVPENREFADSLGANAEGKKAYQIWRDPDPVDPFSEGASIVDNQVAILQYANGVRATFHTNCNAAIHERRMYILGSHGSLRVDAITGKIELRRIGFDTPTEVYSMPSGNGHYGGDALMSDRLVCSMLEGTQPLASIGEGIRSAVSCLGVDQALDTGEIVDLRPLWERVGIDPAQTCGC